MRDREPRLHPHLRDGIVYMLGLATAAMIAFAAWVVPALLVRCPS